MNDILNDLTYSEDRITGNVGITSTPSKLKLRAKTYEGLSRNIAKRRGKNIPFSIPNAYMPQGVYAAGQNNQPQGMLLKNDYTKTDSIKRANMTAIPKKLKTTPDQIKMLSDLNKEKASEIAQPNISIDNIGNTTYQSDAPVINTTYAMPNTENYNVVETKTTDLKDSMSIDDQLDIARQKVYDISTNQDTPVTQAIETNEFEKLDKMTKEYNAITEEYNKSKKILEDKQQESKEKQNELSSIENDLTKINENIHDHREVIDTAKKDISSIRDEMRAVTEKINHKMELIKAAKEKKLKEKLNIEEEASKIMEEIKANDEKISEMKQTLEEKDKERQSLREEEDKILKEKIEIQNEYDRKLEILKAMTLPAEIEE